MDLQSIHPSVFAVLDGLRRPVLMAIDCYVHTVNSHLLLHQVSCVESLRVCILNTTKYPRGGSQINTPLGISPSESIGKIIRNNLGLKSLQISLQRKLPFIHELHGDTKEHGLEQIGGSVSCLEHLGLEGDLHFTEDAWTRWSTNFNWNGLRSLAIANLSLIVEVAQHLEGRLPMLRSLKLFAYKDSHSKAARIIKDDLMLIKAFVSDHNLTQLSLSGFPPAVLFSALQSSGTTMRKLRFHLRENDIGLLLFTGPSYQRFLLSVEHLSVLQRTCPKLERLGIDVSRSQLAEQGENPAIVVQRHSDNTRNSPQPNHPSSVSSQHENVSASVAPAAFSPHVLTGTGFAPVPVPSPIASFPPLQLLPTSHGPLVSSPLLDILASIRPLLHIRLFIRRDHVSVWTLSNPEAISIFRYLRVRKRGYSLHSLIICGEQRGWPEVWIIRELGQMMATLEYHPNDHTDEYVKEMWDTEAMALQSHKVMIRTWIPHLEWGISEGW